SRSGSNRGECFLAFDRRWRASFPADGDETQSRRWPVTLEGLEHRNETVENSRLRGRQFLPIEHPGVEPPGQSGDLILIRDFLDFESGLAKLFHQFIFLVTPLMSHSAIERTVEVFAGGNEDDDAAAGLQQLIGATKGGDIVIGMLENVDAHHRVERVTRKIETIIVIEIEALDDDARTPTERVAQPVDVGSLF